MFEMLIKNCGILSLIFSLLLLTLRTTANSSRSGEDISNLQVLTVATKWTESLTRFLRSAKVNGIKVDVLGLGDEWEGGQVRTGPGGGQKVNLVKKALEKLKLAPNFGKKIVLFTESYDSLLLGTPEQILKQFKMSNSRVLFGAEGFCWPDEKLTNDYPEVHRGKRFLNSGGYIGYASTLFDLISNSKIANSDDDQLYFTKLYLSKEFRKMHKIKLDYKSTIFHNLNGATGELELRFVEGSPVLFNTQYNTHPLVLHGNGHTKSILNTYGNYLPKNWNEEGGYATCWDEMISLADVKDKDLPPVLIGVFIEKGTPFLEEFLQKIVLLDYPKNKVHLFLHNNVEYHSKLVNEFIANYTPVFASFKKILPEDKIKEWHARNLAVKHAVKKNCGFFFSVDSEAHLDNPSTLKLLIEQNRGIVAPMLVRPNKTWSNFWGALSPKGFYARSNDYMDIVKGDRRGLWNVPFINGVYLVNSTILNNENLRPNYINNLLDADMAFCLNNRNRNIFMHVSNRFNWGHLVKTDNFNTSHVHDELYQFFDNRLDWELRYLHPNASDALDPNRTVQAMMNDNQTMPCQDVFWFPIVTPRFCSELITQIEVGGGWTDGRHYDPSNPESGYDGFPTNDKSLSQSGLHTVWQAAIEAYVAPLASKVFGGYEGPPAMGGMFVVRYRPEEINENKAHHDLSTYTINIGLNTPHVDFEGGGCRFTRFNCSVLDTKVGWLLLHPGRLSHRHEGLPTLKGKRYILISFMDP